MKVWTTICVFFRRLWNVVWSSSSVADELKSLPVTACASNELAQESLPELSTSPIPCKNRAIKREFSVFSLKRDVLDNLERYQMYIKRLKHADPKAYIQYRRLGAYIIPPDGEANLNRLEPGFLKAMPSFFAIMINKESPREDPEENRGISPRFCYFQRYDKTPYGIEHTNGLIYVATIYYDDSKVWAQWSTGTLFHCAISVVPDGTVQALRMLKTETQVLRHRSGHWRGRDTTISHQRWGLPNADWQEKYKDGSSLSVKLVNVFHLGANFWLHCACSSMIRITANKDNVTMPFVIQPTDVPAFFSDRDLVVNQNGRKKRVFHMVRTHPRVGSKGVRMHFRGLRQFRWNNYDIAITVPGYTNVDIADLSIPAYEWEEDGSIPEGMMDTEKLTNFVGNAIEIGKPQ